MSINGNSHFALNPTNIEIPRSTWHRPHKHVTTFNVGELIPFHVEEVLPGETLQMHMNKVIRLQTLLTPIFDNIYVDITAWFVPMRLTWNHTKEFFGENTTSPWVSQIEYAIPQITPPTGGYNIGTIADYMGIPTGVDGFEFSALQFRAYALICNEFWRDQNLQDPLLIPMDDSTRQGVNTGDQISDIALGGKPFIACKLHDGFTSALPSPQKSASEVTIGVSTVGALPVVPLNQTWDSNDVFEMIGEDPDTAYRFSGTADYLLANNGGQLSNATADGYMMLSGSDPGYIHNLWAINAQNANATTINQLRTAFQIQKFYERAARGGTRYQEVILSHFGVTSPDARLQRPEYLGGKRMPVTINQIIQQSATGSGDTPQGTVTGMSLTTDSDFLFEKSFTEHGYIICCAVARYDHTYQQGLHRMWSRKSMFDFYWPEFAHLGEQEILNKEIYCKGYRGLDGEEDTDNEVFGYQERWWEYRYLPNRVSGEMRSQYEQSLDVWHLADDYAELPRLSAEWIREDKSNVDRVLAVSSEVSNQILMDVGIVERVTMPMPMYSIPGLIDHF